MFHITLVCDGLTASAGGEAARDIAQDFAKHRTWHAYVACEWESSRLVLRAENDFDDDGEATLDEFSECITAHVAEPGNFVIAIQSVLETDDDKV
jgi:hypothetical protein